MTEKLNHTLRCRRRGSNQVPRRCSAPPARWAGRSRRSTRTGHTVVNFPSISGRTPNPEVRRSAPPSPAAAAAECRARPDRRIRLASLSAARRPTRRAPRAGHVGASRRSGAVAHEQRAGPGERIQRHVVPFLACAGHQQSALRLTSRLWGGIGSASRKLQPLAGQAVTAGRTDPASSGVRPGGFVHPHRRAPRAGRGFSRCRPGRSGGRKSSSAEACAGTAGACAPGSPRRCDRRCQKPSAAVRPTTAASALKSRRYRAGCLVFEPAGDDQQVAVDHRKLVQYHEVLCPRAAATVSAARWQKGLKSAVGR